MYSLYCKKNDGLDEQAELIRVRELFGQDANIPLGHQWGIGLNFQLMNRSCQEIRCSLIVSEFMLVSQGPTEEYAEIYVRGDERMQLYPSRKYGHFNLCIAIPYCRVASSPTPQ